MSEKPNGWELASSGLFTGEPDGLKADEYQRLAARTSDPTMDKTMRLLVDGCGLSTEVGEVNAHIRNLGDRKQAIDLQAIILELGDVAWYLADICTALGISLSDVLRKNDAKLKARWPNGFLK